MAVGQDLNFNVPRLGHKLFDENPVIAKAVGRLVLGRLKSLADLVLCPSDPHALAAAASAGLDHHRIADFASDFDRLVRVRNQAHVARHGADARLLGQLLGRNLVAHRLDCADGRPDKGNPCGLQSLGEFWVFRQGNHNPDAPPLRRSGARHP